MRHEEVVMPICLVSVKQARGEKDQFETHAGEQGA